MYLHDCKKIGEKRYYLLFPKKDHAITELEEEFLTFGSLVLTLQQENDFLRPPLTIIMQEKSEADNNQSRSRECLVQVDKSRGKYGRAKRSQKSVPANSTETRNSFEPPRNSEELEVRNVANQKTNSGDNDQQTPSSSSFSQRRTRKTMQPVSTESVTNDHDQPQLNYRKKIIIAGDSTLKYLRSHRRPRNLQVKIATFPGCTTQYMTDRIKPLLRRNPLQIIIHVGTNSVSSSNSPRECVEEVGDLAKSVTSESSAKTTISSLICRSDDDD